MSSTERPSEPIRFSHVEAQYEAQILCPDCGNYLIYAIGAHVLECCKCHEQFKRPTVTLERVPSEDYTPPDPHG